MLFNLLHRIGGNSLSQLASGWRSGDWLGGDRTFPILFIGGDGQGGSIDHNPCHTILSRRHEPTIINCAGKKLHSRRGGVEQEQLRVERKWGEKREANKMKNKITFSINDWDSKVSRRTCGRCSIKNLISM